MFRKIQDTLSNAASSAASALGLENNNDKIKALQSMGYTYDEASQALRATSGDVDRAAELLLLSTTTSVSTSTTPQQQQQQQQQRQQQQQQRQPQNRNQNTHDDDEDAALQRIMQESYELEQQRQQRTFNTTTNNNNNTTIAKVPAMNRTAAMRKAAEAAEQREKARQKQQEKTSKTTKAKIKMGSIGTSSATDTTKKAEIAAKSTANTFTTATKSTTAAMLLTTHHPDVQIVPKLQEKSIEEQIIRSVDRMKSYPNAVDTLYKIIISVRNNPTLLKFRTIDTNHPGYQRSIANVPGTETFLYAMNYRKPTTSTVDAMNNNNTNNNNNNNNKLVLDVEMIDHAILFLGISALEQAKSSKEYNEAKALLTFTNEIEQIIRDADQSTEIALSRSKFMSQCPTEPPDGRGAYVQIKFASSVSSNIDETKQISLNGKQQQKQQQQLSTASLSTPTSSIASIVLRRRFDGDDTVQDIIHFIGSFGGQVLVDKIQTTGEYILYNLNQYPPQPLFNCTNKQYTTATTLQYVGCWPSGKLEIRPAVPSPIPTQTEAGAAVAADMP